MGCEDAIQYGALMLPLHIGRDNKAMKSAIEKHGLGRANGARPLWRRYMPNSYEA